jgi:hypothetical protein
MTKVRLIGDIHGDINSYRTMAAGADRSIQIGDFGFGFIGGFTERELIYPFHSEGDRRFIRGNHDDPAKCKAAPGYIPDGTIEGDVMFIGGGFSIDRARRIEGISWWPDEELDEEQSKPIITTYLATKPRVMITHDAPHSALLEIFEDVHLHKPIVPSKTSFLYDMLLSEHQPERWYFGHWHMNREAKIGNTIFRCIADQNFLDVDLWEEQP